MGSLRWSAAAILSMTQLAWASPSPPSMSAGEIRLALEKLNVLGRVLYVAAHPDDENTGLIAYWANGALYDTAYLSMTRGDGGQNLIGPELREPLGVIRTQELLAARRVDHGQQFFTRANDFGYSKSVDETLRIWDREKILADTVWVIRQFRPDVIATRFALEDDFTHGHHTASARLTKEAFAAAADPKRFPEQLSFVRPWQATRLLWNTSEFFFRNRNLPFDPQGLIKIDAGGYQPLLGKSYAELEAASRTMHKSQGFGVSIDRSAQKEFFKLLDGKPVAGIGDPGGQDASAGRPGSTIPATTDLFSGIDTTWSRVPQSAEIPAKIAEMTTRYDIKQPAALVPALLELRNSLGKLGQNEWALQKRTEVEQIIGACLGLHLEAVAEKETAQPGEKINLQFEAINRSEVAVKFKSLRLLEKESVPVDLPLPNGELVTKKVPVEVPEKLPFSQPYWLRLPGTLGTFAVDAQTLIGQPENPPAFPVEVAIDINGEEIIYQLEPRFRKIDRVEGETSRPLVIAPPVFVELPRPLFVFGDAKPKTLNVRVIASTEKVKGEVFLEAPAGWKVEPASAPFELYGADGESSVIFKVTPPATAGHVDLRASWRPASGEKREAFSRQRIEYPHIEPQMLIAPAQAQLVRASIENKAAHVGYLPGAGDAIPESLREIGSEVTILNEGEVKADKLAGFDAIVLGVRACNVTPARVAAWLPELVAYAKKGGVVVYQYNTTPGPKPEHLPFPLKISRDRVTDENAEVRILAPDHPLLSRPNKITAQDFAGWVQERGLYFPNEWDKAWTPILSSNDPGEKPADGSLLIARMEKGWFVYTGLSFFRELPAGVPGAYRLFANMISLGK